MKVSILDQMFQSVDATLEEAMGDIRKLAQLVDELGYHRIWYSEHHGMEGVVNSAPEMMVAHIAGLTQNIRLGTGGVLMPNHIPYKLAEEFKALSVMAPGRIDFGVGRAPGGTAAAMFALRQGRRASHESYDEIKETLDYIDEVKNRRSNLLTAPMGIELPEAWMLGSSGQSALVAAKYGMGYSHANFITGNPNPESIKRYNESFMPSEFMQKPQINSGFFAVIGETDEEAGYHAKAVELSLLMLATQNKQRFTTEQAQAYTYSLFEQETLKDMRDSGRLIVGSAQKVANFFYDYQEQFGIDEVMLATNVQDQKFKRKGFELLAQEMKLNTEK